MGISSANDHVSLDFRVRYLACDVLVGETDDHAIFGSVVLVLVLNAKALASEVIGNSLCKETNQ